jgi:GTPase Era involved in 16S rRNA processing
VQAVPGTAPTPRKNGVITAVQDQAVIVAKVLNLSTNQTLQWESIIQDSISQGIDIYLDDTLTDDDKKAAFIQLRANAITELRQLCTPVQQKLLDRMLAASKRDAKQIAEYAQLDQKIFMTLSLNDSQTDRWSAILQDTQQKGMDIFQNDDLTDDQKHAALIAVNKAAIAKLRLYLTPLQQKNLDRLASGI